MVNIGEKTNSDYKNSIMNLLSDKRQEFFLELGLEVLTD